MKEAIVHPGTKVEIVDSPVPLPNSNEVLIKVVVTGTNPKDWKGPEWTGDSLNQGDDIAGIIHSVGEEVVEFKRGDRVAALHPLRTRGGSYAEFALAPAYTTFHLPKKISFEEAAALPLAALTAAVALYARLNLSPPWLPRSDDDKIPLVIYGASSAVGSYAVQFAQRSNIHPLILTAGRSREHVEKFIDPSKGDVVLDYRDGEEAVANGIRAALHGRPLEHVFDATTSEESTRILCNVIDMQKGLLVLVLPQHLQPMELPEALRRDYSNVMDVHSDLQDFGLVYSRLLAKGLEAGWFVPQPHVVIPGGLNGIQEALTKLRNGEARAVKYVLRIAETPGLSST
ncbi:chaperonin 10-like protein [Neohortaea acidophila]|uniref:Chaperonin 10-like protein n=1 Tax=Neohortaea acidophila TaxID=245834 RepID=A0A6A6Q4Z1_9PEZI|nr:chaperonin 10-like protein [Neohortaea acidophila]KAF2486477.1 chaperonin 10-like protein [Neohortaea acidophila]